MIDTDAIPSLIETYERHGWQLRRLVVADIAEVGQVSTFGVPVEVALVNAAWFSRPPQDGPVAWEVRFLGPVQFALVVDLDETAPDFDTRLHETEQRLADTVAAKRTA